jgi:hypothetical protein
VPRLHRFFSDRSHPPKTFRRLLILSLAFAFLTGLPAFAAAPPTSENAYCGKGDIAQFGTKDGLAELPKTCYYTALDGTPSPGKQIHIAANANLAAALEGAKCGDTLLLPAGVSFEVGILPSKKCDERHYITVRTDTPDSKLPPEGTRISPAWGGVASLPGRPPFAQPAGGPAKLMATFVVKRPGGAVVGDHVRFIGIEWTTDPSANINRIVSAEHADHVIFDRNWVHPGEGAEVAHGVGMPDGAHVIALINSYVHGLNCIARMGKCTDATAVGGGHSNDPVFTFKIYNNFLESSGENILFGGAPATAVSTDIEIRRNHLFRPMLWKEEEPGYTPSPKGAPYIVKNNFELKSAIRVLFEANLLENSWGGFSQTGFSILLSPRNQSAQCPVCRVNDVTVRFNRVRNVAAVFNISNSLSKEGAAAADGGRYSIHDIIADNVHAKDYKGHGGFMLFVSWQPPVHDVQIDHVTAFVPGVLLAVLNPNAKLENFTLTNSVFSVGDERPPIVSAGGGPDSCASRTQRLGPEAILKECFSSYKFEKNLIINPRGSLPAGNITASSPEEAGVRDLKNGISKDPRLCREKGPNCPRKSPGASAADGRDLGADVDAVEAAIAGVE